MQMTKFISHLLLCLSLCFFIFTSSFSYGNLNREKNFSRHNPKTLYSPLCRSDHDIFISNSKSDDQIDLVSVDSKINIRKTSKKAFIREILSGFIVALATLPASAAYGSLIGISPLLGIWSSIIVGLSLSLLGTGPSIIAGAAGVIAIPIAKLVHETNNIHFMTAAILLSSILEFLFSIFKLGRLGNLVTEPVIIGFMNAFALYLLNVQVSERKIT